MRFFAAFKNYYLAAVIVVCINGVLLPFLQHSSAQASEQKPPYSRSDCIVKIILRTNIYSETYWKNLTSDVSKSISSHEFNIQKYHVSNISIPYERKNNVHAIYMQFFDDYRDRVKLATSAMQNLKAKIPNFPRYFILSERITPNPKTIDACGPFWSDCKPLGLPTPGTYHEIKGAQEMQSGRHQVRMPSS